jgi:hypothetical protein
MIRLRVLAVGALLAIGTATLLVATAFGSHDGGSSGGRQIALRDDCDPRDPAWNPTGGCKLRRGDVTFAEFNEEVYSDPTLADEPVGHQAWRFDPPYLKIEEGQSVRVRNRGGRDHTFTEVNEFGGGFVPPLSMGLVMAPECDPNPQNSPLLPPPVVIPPGGSTRVSGLEADPPFGNHRFQCCIHPWQRALIKVLSDDEEEDDDD